MTSRSQYDIPLSRTFSNIAALTSIGFTYYAHHKPGQTNPEIYVALAVSDSCNFSRNNRTKFYTLGYVYGKRFGSKVEKRHYYTKIQSYRDIEDEGGIFVAIVHVGDTTQPHCLIRDQLVASAAAGPSPNWLEDSDNEADEERLDDRWNTKKWAGIALKHLMSGSSFVPCNGVKITCILDHIFRQTDFIMSHCDMMMTDERILVLQIGEQRDYVVDSGCEIDDKAK
ncbi:hypothetical protein CVT24_006037 [Panaeolus cyanescens]|uniref:Uncharacterized protein n=1 Tax=Panaeolus cyanescens TaxID=181874 RepID=A0A409YE65_9AGAR|nr:hypothetical protein CVT24_006037 [Panaeolus cyanescens]